MTSYKWQEVQPLQTTRECGGKRLLPAGVVRGRLAHVFPEASVEAAFVAGAVTLAVVGALDGAADSEAGRWADVSHSGAETWFGAWIVSCGRKGKIIKKWGIISRFG